MSLSVKHLNADTTFLLTFSPTVAPDKAEHTLSSPFTILVDPWLAGHSSIWNPRFQISHHTTPSCIQSLADIPLPDVILISQAKPDHCHRETLCTLSRDVPATIYAVPEAAKLIRSWNHFRKANIVTLAPYNRRKPASVGRIAGLYGQVTISHIFQKADMTGLHNAIGITYRPPGASVGLPVNARHSPDRSSNASSPPSMDLSIASPVDSAHASPEPSESCHLPLPSTAPEDKVEQTISILYTPHGVSHSAIRPYIDAHLKPLDALPLTAFFHCINIEQNPWLMGGLVAPGLPGGIQLVKRLGARYWVSAHDEVKDNQGWSTAWIKSKQYAIADAQAALDAALSKSAKESDNDMAALKRTRTIVMELGVGEEFKT